MAGTEVGPSAVVAYTLKEATSWWEEVNNSPAGSNIPHPCCTLRHSRRRSSVRALVFVFRRDVQKVQPEILQHILLGMPSLAFFTTYALLVLFWAEIYYQARAVSTDGLRPSFLTINGVVYAIQNNFVWGPTAYYIGRRVFVCSLGFSSLWRKALLDVAAFPCRIKGTA